MRAFIAIVIKDIRVRFSSAAELVFFILLPVVFTIVLSGVSVSAAKDRAHVPLVLLQDTVGSAQTRAFGRLLGSMPGVRVREVTDPTLLISSSEPDVLIGLTPGSGTDLPFALTLRLSPWSSSARTTGETVSAWLRAARSGTQTPAAAPEAGAPAAPGAAAPVVAAPVAPAPGAAETSNAGEIITWVLVPLLGLGAGLISERMRGTRQRVLAAPVSSAVVSAAGVTAEVLAALVQIALLIAFGAMAFRLPWLSHPLHLLGLSVAFCFAGAALGALLGAVCRTRRQASSLALALALVMAVLGGCWYPAALFPASLQGVVKLNPAGWAMTGFLSVLSPRPGAGQAVSSMVMLLTFGVVVFVLAAAASRRRASRAA